VNVLRNPRATSASWPWNPSTVLTRTLLASSPSARFTSCRCAEYGVMTATVAPAACRRAAATTAATSREGH